VLLDPASEAGAGIRFLQALRADAKLANVPVVVLTGSTDRAPLLEAARLGVRHYLLKSKAAVRELLDRVDQCVRAQSPKPVGVKSPSSAAPLPEGSAGVQPVKVALPAKSPAQPTRLLTREQCLARAETALQAKTLSGTVIQVIAMATSPRTDMSELAEAIARDVVLSAKVLQVANSASYASARGMIAGIPEAVRRIGCATIRNIAASVGVFEAMPETGADGFNPIRSWQHSFAVGRLCEQLTAGGPMSELAGTAYLAGLCHDLGEILFRTHFAPEYGKVLDAYVTSRLPMRQLEREMLGMTHDELSATILRALDLPQAIREPIEAMHADVESTQPLGRVLRLADSYANGMLLAARGNFPGRTARSHRLPQGCGHGRARVSGRQCVSSRDHDLDDVLGPPKRR
jgi:HD-like signal output (HDOD) protein